MGTRGRDELRVVIWIIFVVRSSALTIQIVACGDARHRSISTNLLARVRSLTMKTIEMTTWTASRNWCPSRVDVLDGKGTEVQLCPSLESAQFWALWIAHYLCQIKFWRVFFENIDFHQKFTKIEDFKVDHSKKTTKFHKSWIFV